MGCEATCQLAFCCGNGRKLTKRVNSDNKEIAKLFALISQNTL